MMNDKVPKKLTATAVGVTALSLCDKGLEVAICITIISVVGILAQAIIDIKTKGKENETGTTE